MSAPRLLLAAQINAYIDLYVGPDGLPLRNRTHLHWKPDGSVLIKYSEEIGHLAIRAMFLAITDAKGDEHPEVYPSSTLGKSIKRPFDEEELHAFVSHRIY